MRVSSVLRLAFALTTVAVAAACSTTVSGNGREHTPAAGASSTHGFPSQPASSSGASSSSAPPTTPATTPAPPRRPTRAQLDARLAALTPGQRHLLVAIPGGFEAISYDQSGHIGFWRNSGAAWLQVGASTYPYSSGIGAPADAAATGALLRDMQHATFIVTGVFTTDGSGNAVAYTTGPRGWGAIKAEPNGNIGPSGQPIGADGSGCRTASRSSTGCCRPRTAR
jgi:hypothetical protein